MPTYEYRCAAGHHFERFQRMSEPPVERCPECGAKAERLLSAGGGVIFKGSGFYITDYRSDTYKKAAEADSGASKSAEGSGSKSESGAKPAPGGKSESSGKTESSAKPASGGKSESKPSKGSSGSAD